MKKNLTKLVCFGIACFYIASAIAQENKPAVGVIEEKDFPQKDEIELKKGENKRPEVLPDSIITYSAAGERVLKRELISKDINLSSIPCIYYNWENNNWILEYEGEIYFSELNLVKDDQYYLFMPVMGLFYNGTYYYIDKWGDGSIYPVNITYNADGQVNVIEIIHYDGDRKGQVWLSYNFLYNENGQLISRIDYNYDYQVVDKRNRQYDYFYNDNGDMTLYEYYAWYDGEKMIYNWSIRQIAKYDSQGKKIREERYAGNANLGKFLLYEYDIYYYENDDRIPNATVENNTPVGNDNQGSFDLEVNIPTDSISNGSITITFPEGFTLDEKNTSLTLDFADLFDLIITKQDNNSWLFEIKPKTLKSASLRADEVTKMLQVAYTVDEKLLRGTYDISVNSILFESKGGNYIPEPAITVPVQLNRWGVSNVKVESNSIWASDGNLYIRTDKTCTLSVYTVYGQLFRQQTINAGETIIPLPQGIYFVKAGETTKKIIAK